jgi:UDP-N-acetylmuramate--alanine ligase
LWLAPEIAVVTNIEADHLDFYDNEVQIRDAFSAFAASLPPNGVLIACADDAGAAELAAGHEGRVVTYGLRDGMVRGEVIERGRSGTLTSVSFDGSPAGELALRVPGEHNVRNALAALAVAREAGVGFEVAAPALASFSGVARRFQVRGMAAGVTLVDDYAHHPTEVAATLASARERGWQRVIAVFQPHRFTRTRHMGAALGASLAAADLAVVTDVYGAGEEPEPGVTGKLVVDGVLAARPTARVAYIPSRLAVPELIASRARAGDLVMTIGAGDVTMLGDDILASLADRAAKEPAR